MFWVIHSHFDYAIYHFNASQTRSGGEINAFRVIMCARDKVLYENILTHQQIFAIIGTHIHL